MTYFYKLVKNIENGPTEDYYLEYKRLDALLDHLVVEGAASGEEWDVTKDRDDFFNPILCRKQARLRAAKIGIEATICGKCIQICPYTQRYVNTRR